MSEYVGTELEVFETAHNWKRYMLGLFREHISGRVLEVGAGIGGTTRFLAQAPHREWLCLEPDPRLADEIRKAHAAGELPPSVQIQAASTLDLQLAPSFDTILYIDVLEHLDDDAAEMRRASALLAPGGALIVFGPAMPWLYSPFDAAIGHYRRYTRASLSQAAPPELQQQRLHYVDSLGVLLSLGNRLLLRNPYPKRHQIELWDRKVVPMSRRLDPLLRFAVGKSILGVWRKPLSTA